jgi:enterobactin synthetase component D
MWSISSEKDILLCRPMTFHEHAFAGCDDVVVVTTAIEDIDVQGAGISLPPDIRLSVRSRQNEYVAGRLCAQHALHRLTGDVVVVRRSESGLPIWPDGIVGSISHCAGTACAAVGFGVYVQHLGVDVETVVAANLVGEVLSFCACASEITRYNDPISATLLFSAKEAVYKAYSHILGNTIEFTDLEIVNIDYSTNNVHLQTTRALGSIPSRHAINCRFIVLSDVVLTLVIPR